MVSGPRRSIRVKHVSLVVLVQVHPVPLVGAHVHVGVLGLGPEVDGAHARGHCWSRQARDDVCELLLVAWDGEVSYNNVGCTTQVYHLETLCL